MGEILKVFISATTADLGAVRTAAKHALLTLGYFPIEQEHFGAAAETVLEMDRRKLASCDAVLHIVGECYGHEPPVAEPGGQRSGSAGAAGQRRSYTQLEYDHARELAKPLSLIVCEENFPYTAHEPEPVEKQALQRAHRQAILAGDHKYERIADPSQLQDKLRMFDLQVHGLGSSRTVKRLRFALWAIIEKFLRWLAAIVRWLAAILQYRGGVKADSTHLAILRKGVETWNEWRRTTEETPDLRSASLEGADLRDVNLYGADLRGANLCRVNFFNADLSGADLAEAQIGSTSFANCDLSDIRGLESIIHQAPSSIGLDSIYRSKGRVPESFLRGCGIADSFITQMRSLVNAQDGIQFFSCFISYSGRDEEFARRLHSKMRDAHMRVWFAPDDMVGGALLDEQIETAIRVYDKYLVVLSEASLKSDWVMDELKKAFRSERESGKRKIFPVRLTDYETLRHWECRDSRSGKDLAIELREYFIPDFSNWKDHTAFDAAFARLLADFRAEFHD